MRSKAGLARRLKWLSGTVFVAWLMAPSWVLAQTSLTEQALDPSVQYSEADEAGRYLYLIGFREPGLLAQARELSAAETPLNMAAPQMQDRLASLRVAQAQHVAEIGWTLGRSPEVTHHFIVSHSGIALRLTPEEARELAQQPNVASIERERVYQLDTFRGPEFIGAGGIWDGSALPSGPPGLRGAGMVVAVLDSAVDVTSPSFANDPACGHGTTAPNKVLSNLNCAGTDTNGLCNALPGAANAHGTHVAGTVLGNAIDQTAPAPAPNRPISGVAPCASLRAYDVCPSNCPGANVQAAMNSVLLHADVDALSFSISGGTNPWVDNDLRKLDLVDAGIFVAASAGNTRDTIPDPVGQVNHRGPWVFSVAASSHDRFPDESRQGNPLSLHGGPQNAYSIQGNGPAMSVDYVGPLRFAGDVSPGNEFGCSPFPAGAFAGGAALIARGGGCFFSTKVNHAVAAGAQFVVVYNNVADPPTAMTGLASTTVSSVMVDQATGLAMVAALAGGTATLGVQAALQSFPVPALGDQLASFSLRGPTPAPLQHLQKPDITAPGVNIYAAIPGGYGLLSGTSMSSPHVVGAGLLLTQAQPAWTPVEVRSALQMTASRSGRKQNNVDPWDADDVGSGRVDLTRAARAGLVMHETKTHFLAANPASGGDVRTLNLPALRDLDCTPQCAFTRTVRNTLSEPSSWSVALEGLAGQFTVDVSPATFEFTGGLNQTQTITFTFAPIDTQTAAINFGHLVFSEAAARSPDLHYTVALMGLNPPQASIDASAINFELLQNGSGQASFTLSNAGDGALIYTIAEAAPSMVSLGHTQSEGPTAPIELRLDDGIATIVGQGSQQWLWMNQFTPGPLDLPFTLQAVDIGFAPGSGGVLAGDLFDVYVWVTPDRDPTSGATLVAQVLNQAITSGVNFQTITLPGGGVPITIDSGDVLIGVVNRTSRATYFVAVADSPGNFRQRSWIGRNFPGNVAPTPPVFSAAGEFGRFGDAGMGTLEGRNWTIRGYGTGGSACLDPSDVPWLTVAPVAGTIPSEGSQQITVTVNMDGLGTGVFEARLCLQTNDPALPVAVIPVTVHVQSTQPPAAPTINSVTAGNQQLTIDFSAPADDGGSAITSYQYSLNDGADWTSFEPAIPTSPVTISGLVNGTGYQLRLRAVNAIGAGAPTGTQAVTLPAPTVLAFTTPAQSSGAGQSSAEITVALRNAAGTETLAAGVGGVTINLTAAPQVGFRNLADSAPISSIFIPQGQSSASFRATGTVAGNYSLTAAATGFTSVNQPFSIVPGALARFEILAAGGGAIGTQTAGMVFEVRIRALDDFNNIVTSYTSTVTLTSTGDPEGDEPVITPAFTAGELPNQPFAVVKAGSIMLTASGGNPAVTGTSAPFTVEPGPISTAANGSLLSGTNLSRVADGSAAATITVQLRDANGNNIAQADQAVVFATTRGTLSAASVNTDANGVATVTLTSTEAGTATVTATIGGNAVTNGSPVTVTFTAGAISTGANGSLLSGTNLSRVADGSAAATISVQLRDANGNNIAQADQAVAFATTRGTLSAASVNTDANGVTTVTLTSTEAGTAMVTATIGGNAVTNGSPVTVTFTAGAASQMAIQAGNNQSATVGTEVTIAPSVILRDANGNPVAGVAVTFAASHDGTVDPTTAITTGVDGIAAVTSWALGTGAGPNTLTARADGLTDVTFTATGTADAATQMVIQDGNGQIAAVGAQVATAPSVLVSDFNGNPVAGVSVTFAVASGGGTVDPTTPVTTGADGIAAVTSWTLGAIAGANTLTAVSGSLTGSPITFSATGTAGAATNITITTQPSPTAASGAAFTQQPAIQLRDASGNAVSQSGFNVTVTINSGGGTLVGTDVVTTNESGVATFTNLAIAGTIGDRTLRFTSGSLAAAVSNIITIVPGAADAGASTLSAAPTSIVADGESTSTITVQLKDASGNNLTTGGATVFLTTTSGSLSQPTLTTDSNGVATATLTSATTAGTATVIAHLGADANAPEIGITTVEFVPGDGTQMAIQAGDGQTAAVGAQVATAPSVLVSDVNGNPVAGVSVTFAVASGGGTVDPTTPVTTGADGIAAVTSWTLGTTAGANTLTAASGSLTGSPITFSATGTAPQFTLTVSNGSGSGSYPAGRAVSISANPAPDGQVFDGWTGDVAALANSKLANTTLTMPAADVTVVASYRGIEAGSFTLTVTDGTGSGDYAAGDVVSIAADLAPEGQVFAGWTGQTDFLANPSLPNTELIMPASAVSVTASYKGRPAGTFSLTVESGTGDGSYLAGESVLIAADVPAEGLIFERWVGDTEAVTNVNLPNTTLTMPAAAVSLKATFIMAPPEPLILRVRVRQTGSSGSSMAGARSGQPREESIEERPVRAGRNARLQAPPAPEGFVFDGWEGQTSRVANMHQADTFLHMPVSDVTVIATYKPQAPDQTLSVESGSGSGSYAPGTLVTITAATPEAGQVFVRWEGQTAQVANVNRPSTSLVMPQTAVTIQAVYRAIPDVNFALTVSAGDGGGPYGQGAMVDISAGAAPEGQIFAQWQGQVGTVADLFSPSTTLYMPGNAVEVVAGFTQAITVTAVVMGEGGTVDPASQTVAEDAQATITVTPQAGWTLDSVTGCGNGGSLSGDQWTTAPIVASCELQVRFELLLDRPDQLFQDRFEPPES